MKNRERIQARFLRDALPARLAGLAADLGRVASSARHATGGAAATAMLEESQYLIEWTAAEGETRGWGDARTRRRGDGGIGEAVGGGAATA